MGKKKQWNVQILHSHKKYTDDADRFVIKKPIQPQVMCFVWHNEYDANA